MRISLNHRPNCWIRIQKEETNYRIRPIAALLYDRIPPLKKLGLFLTAVPICFASFANYRIFFFKYVDGAWKNYPCKALDRLERGLLLAVCPDKSVLYTNASVPVQIY